MEVREDEWIKTKWTKREGNRKGQKSSRKAEESLHVRNFAYLAGEDIAMAYFKKLSLHITGAKQTETLVRNTGNAGPITEN
jgi:hypothetical protein